MKTLSQKTIMAALGALITATLFVPNARAGCGVDPANWQLVWDSRPLHSMGLTRGGGDATIPSTPQPAEPQPDVANGPHQNSIVGMWRVEFLSKGNTAHNPPIPDGVPLDFGYSQWHSDGTEIMNSGGRAPATQNFCMGVWQTTGHDTYQLNHLALSYDAVTGLLNGKVRIQESVTLSVDGSQYAGSFTIDAFDPQGNPVDHVTGEVDADRVTLDTVP